MNTKNSLIVFFAIAFSASGLAGMTFVDFKKHIVDESSRKSKSGAEIYQFITPILEKGVDIQIESLTKHMKNEGHFGINRAFIDRSSARSKAKRWGTFFVKLDHTFFEDDNERIALVRSIWDSQRLEYAGDVPGALNIVYLDGEVQGVVGVAFKNYNADRQCFTIGGDLNIYEKENRAALVLAIKGDLKRSDFETDEDWEIAQTVHKAVPHIVQRVTIRVKLNCTNGRCEFNTCFPKD